MPPLVIMIMWIMMFGLVCTSMASSQAFANYTMDMLGKLIIVFTDDILVYNFSHVRFKDYSKRTYLWMQENVNFFFLDIISKEGFLTEEWEVCAVTEWPTSNMVKYVHKFLGCANFYHTLTNLMVAHLNSIQIPQQKIHLITLRRCSILSLSSNTHTNLSCS